MKKEEIENLVKASCRLDNLYDDFKELSKKYGDKVISKYSINNVNAVINECNDLLKKAQNFNENVKSIDEDQLPTNNDILILLNQIRANIEGVRLLNIELDFSNRWVWKTKEVTIYTNPPKGVK